MNRERKTWVAVLLLSVSMIVVACGDKEEAKEKKSMPVSVTAVEKGDLIQTDDIAATIDAGMVVDVVPKLTGRVASVHVEEGQTVKKGQLLAQLETSELKIQLQQAQAGLVSAKNARTQTLSAVKQAESSYQNTKNSFKRIETLHEQGIISQQDYENSKLQLEIAQNTYESAKQQTAMDPASGYKYVDATVMQAQASIALINESIKNARVVSPISGTVTARYVDPGEMASGVAFTVVDMDSVTASAKITQKNVTKLKEGQDVKVNIGSLGTKQSTYKITKILPAADDSNTYKVEVNIPNPGHSIKPGMTANIQAATNEIKDVMVLPRDAVVERSGSKIVYVLNGDKVKAKEVVTGEYTDELVEIKKGVKVGDKVVTTGQHLLSDGDAVTVSSGGDDK